MPASGTVLGVFFRKLRCAVSGEIIREGEATPALCHTRELRESGFVMVQAQLGLGCRTPSGLAPERFMFERLTKGLNRHPASDAPTTTVVTQK
jgi:hypothetical protein